MPTILHLDRLGAARRPWPALALSAVRRTLPAHAGRRPAPRRAGRRRPDHASVRAGAGPAQQRARLPALHDGRLALVPPRPRCSWGRRTTRSRSCRAIRRSGRCSPCGCCTGCCLRTGKSWPHRCSSSTAFYGVTYFFWYYAVTTEQYTSAVAWTLAVVCWPSAGIQERARPRSAGAGAAGGRGAGAHDHAAGDLAAAALVRAAQRSEAAAPAAVDRWPRSGWSRCRC